MNKTADMELVKMSTKGQLVVPLGVRETAGLQPGERFVAFPVESGVLFKKIDIPAVKLNFESLAKQIEAQFAKQGISKAEIAGAVKWARKR